MDKFLAVKYDKTNVHEGKAAAKAALQVCVWGGALDAWLRAALYVHHASAHN